MISLLEVRLLRRCGFGERSSAVHAAAETAIDVGTAALIVMFSAL
jgi:hypothetical protein